MELTEINALLEKLSNANGISGAEGAVAKIIRDEVAPYVDEITTDRMGNLVAIKKGDDFKIMLAAHMDEIGLMVQYIDEKGFIRFVGVGGWYNPVLVSQRVILHGEKGDVPGVLGMKPPHVMEEADRKKPIELANLFIDVGAHSAEEVEAMGITVGTTVTIDRDYQPLAGTVVTGKALDNRVGCAMLIGALKEMETKHTIYAVFTVQEEVGLKGAKTAAFSLNPDVAIATDVTIPGDSPGIERRKAPVFMGEGPVVVMVSASGRGHLADPRMVDWLKKTAKKHDIKIQLEVGDGGNTDASAINFERGGIPSVPVSVPARYIHSPVEVIDLKDLQGAIELLRLAVKTKLLTFFYRPVTGSSGTQKRTEKKLQESGNQNYQDYCRDKIAQGKRENLLPAEGNTFCTDFINNSLRFDYPAGNNTHQECTDWQEDVVCEIVQECKDSKTVYLNEIQNTESQRDQNNGCGKRK